MKKIIKLAVIAGFSIAASLAAWVHTSPVSASSSGLASPRSLYLQNCARCHGSDGRSNTTKGRQLDATDLTGLSKSSASITRTIKNGRGDMPGFGKKLSSKQIASIAGYVRSL